MTNSPQTSTPIKIQLKKIDMKKKLYNALIILTSLFIALILIDGFLDLSYVYAKKAKLYISQYSQSKHLPSEALPPPGSIDDIAPEWHHVSVQQVPGIGDVPKEFTSPRVNISADGQRSNGSPPPANPTTSGLLLGASQAVGYLVPDDQTLSAHLQKMIPDSDIRNYAVSGQELPGTRLLWEKLFKQNSTFNFVIIAGGTYGLFSDCMKFGNDSSYDPDTETRLQSLYRQLFKKPSRFCETPSGREMAVEHSMHSIRETLIIARTKNIPFSIVILPTPYDAGQNVSNLENDPTYEKTSPMLEKAYELFHQKLQEIKAPELIDLSRSLGTDQPYFLDIGCHLSGDGYKQIAHAIAQRAAPLFSGKKLEQTSGE
jgi:lysophospholipase L1-like esterase